MLFKMGKFYEMFEMDAHVGVEILGLIYMKASIVWLCCNKPVTLVKMHCDGSQTAVDAECMPVFLMLTLMQSVY